MVSRVRRGMAAAAALLLLPVAGCHGGGSAKHRPNILIIVTDDQRADTMDVMPNTTRLFGAQGETFSHAFVTTPLCCPSRASILTGRYAHNHGIHVSVKTTPGVALPSSPFQRSTLERYLHDAGYFTGIFGKYLNGWDLADDPPYFDRWAILRETAKGSYNHFAGNVQGVQRTINEYYTTYVEEQALSALRASERHDDQPWFMYLAVRAPHSPYTTEPRYRDAPVPPWTPDAAVTEQDRTDKPPFVSNRTASFGRIEAVRAQQLRTLMSVDDMVGTVFTALGDLGEDRDTLAFFVSDNGFMWGEHGVLAEKLFPYPPSVTVPLLMRWPGHVRAGAVDQRIAANIDIAPTVLESARVESDRGIPMDGSSLLHAETRTRLLLEYWKSYGTVPTWASTWTPHYQYVEYDGAGGGVVFREYYALDRDPYEVSNLVSRGGADASVDLASLSKQLAADRQCRGTSGPNRCP
jgi:arylsulfatase A-like enzyme